MHFGENNMKSRLTAPPKTKQQQQKKPQKTTVSPTTPCPVVLVFWFLWNTVSQGTHSNQEKIQTMIIQIDTAVDVEFPKTTQLAPTWFGGAPEISSANVLCLAGIYDRPFSVI